MRTLARIAGAAAMLLCLTHASAKEACEGFKWDVSREHALFLGAAESAVAGKSADTAPKLLIDHLYDLTLVSQEQVQFAAPPSKKMLADGASGGVIRFQLARAGQYRVSLGIPFWIDIVAGGKVVPSVDFNGSPGCDKPRKVVVYDLPADQDLILQFSGLPEEKLHFTLTPVTLTPVAASSK